ncbi:MAG: DNA-binding proteins Bright/BRCAA1/RBP1 and proteins containing BRIGHT domain [Cirrosporium novae-zelandiae]|nr:MAG: DNA-binding proteins Bright/BRCAA1/RBP1 and proteins containing BRIGHT domain [Cirrosporium novae-zelandiae]
MAPAMHTSSIALALAGKTASLDIPKPHDMGSYAAGAVGSGSKKPNMLPTPPSSISPPLPPQGLKARRGLKTPDTPPPQHIESDIDLQDAVEHAKSQDQPATSLRSDSSGAITPNLLAKHHLPDVLLNNGPLAIRHIMGYLTASVPGFSGIPAAKARRLVVAALEGRGSGGEGGGLNGDVVFEKVGWGRWDARLKGHPSRDRSMHQSESSASPPAYRDGVHIPSGKAWDRNKDYQSRSRNSDMDFLQDDQDDATMLENEADKMSLDGDSCDESCSSSEAPDDQGMDEDMGDVTDEEDWASIGAAALRAGSFPVSGGGPAYNYLSANYPRHSHRGGGPSTLPKSVPTMNINIESFQFPNGVTGDSQEREAVEALLRMGSM